MTPSWGEGRLFRVVAIEVLVIKGVKGLSLKGISDGLFGASSSCICNPVPKGGVICTPCVCIQRRAKRRKLRQQTYEPEIPITPPAGVR